MLYKKNLQAFQCKFSTVTATWWLQISLSLPGHTCTWRAVWAEALRMSTLNVPEACWMARVSKRLYYTLPQSCSEMPVKNHKGKTCWGSVTMVKKSEALVCHPCLLEVDLTDCQKRKSEDIPHFTHTTPWFRTLAVPWGLQGNNSIVFALVTEGKTYRTSLHSRHNTALV